MIRIIHKKYQIFEPPTPVLVTQCSYPTINFFWTLYYFEKSPPSLPSLILVAQVSYVIITVSQRQIPIHQYFLLQQQQQHIIWTIKLINGNLQISKNPQHQREGWRHPLCSPQRTRLSPLSVLACVLISFYLFILFQ